jgi:ribosomal protein S18 acetylase RimI-like enzyme
MGIARRLVEAGHEHLRARGARRVTALVAHAEEHAVGLWLSAGYQHDERISASSTTPDPTGTCD